MKDQKNTSRILLLVMMLGAAVFCYELWFFANSLPSVSDEGAYLFKGYMFARGDYYPFQEYAFWTNKAPLAFVIPGYIQYWFGAGLREGRYFAILLAVLMLVGVWIVSNRLAGKGWATLAVWVFALSNAQTAILSQALSQGIVACILTWLFVLVLGENRRVWQLVVGSILAVIIIMTRQNMLPVPIFLVIYIFWRYGKRAGSLSLAATVLTFLGFYLYYGPKLLDLWLEWVPNLQTPFDKVISTTSDPSVGFGITRAISRFQSFVTNIHDHIFVVVGSVSALILWPSKRNWGDPSKYKNAVFLAVTYFSLFIMHIWASIFNDYCVWCLQSYQVFYNPVGLFFIILFFFNYKDSLKWQKFLLFLFLLLVSGGLGLYYYFRWGVWLLRNIAIPLPGRLLAEGKFYTVPLADVFQYRFLLPLDVHDRIASAIGGTLIGLIFVTCVWGVYYFFWVKRQKTVYSVTLIVLAAFFFAGSALAIWQDEPIGKTVCGTKFLTDFEKTGHQLADLVPPNVLLYWRGSGRHLAFMLYMTDVNIFPPQIHAGGGLISPEKDNYIDNTQADDLLRKGVFNQEIDSKWREQADYHILWNENFTKEAQDFFLQPSYVEIPFDMGMLKQCEDPLLVFKKR